MSAELSVAALLQAKATDLQKHYLARCVEVASRAGTPVYLVGGVIRDLLSTGQFLDLDITVEGNGLDLAKELATVLGGRVRTHERFLTAEVILDRDHIDIVTARKETYKEPARLPSVSPGSLEDDLARRDYTINAMALRLWPAGPESFFDPFAGKEDLEGRQLRVLHERSFLDDPTRILRGVRLGARLNLRFEPGTDALARGAIEADAFGPLTPQRLRSELILVLEDREIETSLRQFEELGFLQMLGRANPVSDHEWQTVRALVELQSTPQSQRRGSPEVRWWLTYLMGLFETEVELVRCVLAQRFDLDPAAKETLIAYPERLRHARVGLAAAEMSSHQVCSILDELRPEERVLLMATAEATVAKWLDIWIESLRDLRLVITGRDLMREGYGESPALGRALQATLDARRDGLIKADEELGFALKQLQEEGR